MRDASHISGKGETIFAEEETLFNNITQVRHIHTISIYTFCYIVG